MAILPGYTTAVRHYRVPPTGAWMSMSDRAGSDLLGHHDLDELLVVDLAVTVNVCLADHLIDLLVRKLLTEVGHDVAKLSCRDEAVAVLVEDAEGLLELLPGVRAFILRAISVQNSGKSMVPLPSAS